MNDDLTYAGFWTRAWAGLIDTILLMLVIFPALVAIYGWDYFDAEKTGFIAGPMDFLLSWVVPAIVVIVFWIYRGATPGKMSISARIVDATSGQPPSAAQYVGRYLGYFVSLLPLGLGVVWIAFDRRKQAWHDKLANTVVVRRARTGPDPVRFSSN